MASPSSSSPLVDELAIRLGEPAPRHLDDIIDRRFSPSGLAALEEAQGAQARALASMYADAEPVGPDGELVEYRGVLEYEGQEVETTFWVGPGDDGTELIHLSRPPLGGG